MRRRAYCSVSEEGPNCCSPGGSRSGRRESAAHYGIGEGERLLGVSIVLGTTVRTVTGQGQEGDNCTRSTR